MANFPSVAELRSMSVNRLQTLDITTPEQERIVQTLVDEKIEEGGVSGNIYRLDVPDIQTPEEEAKWQEIMDERTNNAKPKAILPKNKRANLAEEESSKPMIKPTDPAMPELIDYTLTEEDFIRNPELTSRGAKVGDVIQVPKEVLPVADNAPSDTNRVDASKKNFCDFCDSKGRFHKKECATKKVG